MQYRIKEYIKVDNTSRFVAQQKFLGLFWVSVKDSEGGEVAGTSLGQVRYKLEEHKAQELADMRHKEANRLEGTRIHEVE